MQYTPQQEQAFKETFSVRQRRQIFLAAPIMALVVIFILAADEKAGTIFGMPMTAVAPLLFVFTIGTLVFSLKNWRCPACNRYLGKVWNPKHCHSCGVALR